jgi:hypothetical protein
MTAGFPSERLLSSKLLRVRCWCASTPAAQRADTSVCDDTSSHIQYSKPSLSRSQLIRISDNPNPNTKNEKCCSQLSTWDLRRQMSQLSFQTKLDTVSSNLQYYAQKQEQLLSLPSMNKCIIFLQISNKGSKLIFCYLFSLALLISSNFTFTYVPTFLSFRATFCFINSEHRLIPM